MDKLSHDFESISISNSSEPEFKYVRRSRSVPGRLPLEEKKIIGDKLLKRLKAFIKQYPMGVSSVLFENELVFKQRIWKLGDHMKYGFPTFNALLMDFPHTFYCLMSPLEELIIFPASSKAKIEALVGGELTDAARLFAFIWKHIKDVIEDYGFIIPLHEVAGELSKVLGQPVNPLDWCVGKGHTYYFYYYCYKKLEPSPADKIFVELSNPWSMGPDNCQAQVFVMVNKHIKPTLEYQKRREKRKEKEEESTTYSKLKVVMDRELRSSATFVVHEDPVEYLQDDINPGDVLLCLGGYISSPGKFYLNSSLHWQSLEKMMASLKEKYQTFEVQFKNNPATAWEGHLKPGFMVAVKSRSEPIWYRGRIQRRLGEFLFSVVCVDYGDVVISHIKDIRYLLKEFLHPLKIQGIGCVLKLGNHYKSVTLPPKATPEQLGVGFETMQMDLNSTPSEPSSTGSGGTARIWDLTRGKGWMQLETNIFRKLIFNKDLCVRFVKQVQIDKDKLWEVYVHLADPKGLVERHHVERDILRKSRGRYVMSDGEFTDYKEKLQIRKQF